MKRFKDADRLQHILDAISKIDSFLQSYDRKSFLASNATTNAVCMLFVIIGDFAGKLSAGLCSRYPEIPWDKFISMGNSLLRDCHDIDFNMIWDSAKNDLPVLKSQITGILSTRCPLEQPTERNFQSEAEMGRTLYMLDELKRQRAEIYEIAKRNKAKMVFVFGSCARKEETPESDVDFLVEFQDGATLFDHGGLYYELSQFLKRPVDVIDMRGLKTGSEFERSVKEEMVLL